MRIRPTRVRRPRVVLVVLVVGGASLLLGLASRSAHRRDTDDAAADRGPVVDHVRVVAAAPAVAGMQVAVDPDTGLLRPPTPEEARAFAEQVRARLDRSSVGLPVRTRPDGSRSVDLRGRFQTLSVARANENGEIETICVSRAEDVEAVLQGREE